MQKRTTAPARAFAVVALVAAFLVLIVVVANSLGGDDSTPRPGTSKTVTQRHARKTPTKAVYVVQNGDTLTGIAHKTGVSVVRIQDLNPSVDPQILISGEKLKLR